MKGNTASMIALIVAGLVLIVVGGNGYNNYLRTQYEKEYGVLAKHQVQAGEVNLDTALGGSTASMAPINTSTLDPKGALPPTTMSSNTQLQPQLAEGASGKTAPVYRADLLPPIPAAVMAAAKAAPDPEIARFQARLKAMEQERVLLQQKLKGERAGNSLAPVPVKPVVGSATAANAEESGSLREVLDQKPAGNVTGATADLFPQGPAANASAEMAAKAEFARQIKDAPPAGRVVVYNSDWGFVQIDTGANQSVAVGTKFAVRRGTSIVGYVKVTEVNQKTALAEMTSRNQHSETARKPQAGDDVIPWPLF